MMHSIIIIDDEMLIRVGIKSCIEWEKHGFRIAGLAENGADGLALLEREKPSLVITDIKMPVMDGLTFIKKAKERFPDVKIIVLSCLNELDYVKTAIQSGADDYILKLSMEPEKLLGLMKKLCSQKNTLSRKPIEPYQNEQLALKDLQIIREDVFRRYILCTADDTELYKTVECLSGCRPEHKHSFIYGGINDYHAALLKSRIYDKPLFKYSCINVSEELIQIYGHGCALEWDDGHYVFIMEYKEDKNILDFCHHLNRAFSQYMNFTMSFGVSSLEGGNARELFSRCRHAYEACFYYHYESIVWFNDIERRGFSVPDGSESYSLTELLSTDMNAIANKIGEITASLIEKYYHPEQAKKILLRVAYELETICKKSAFEIGIKQSPRDEMVDMILHADNIWQIEAYLRGEIAAFQSLIPAERKGERPEILLIKNYIEQHIDENITLEQASGICNISRSYFSSLFKKETKEGFNDYVNRKKIEKAKSLIENHHYKIYEAAEAVGFHDESYFSKMFKKYEGISPKTFKVK